MLPHWTLAALLLVASVAALRSRHYSLRERPPSNCGFAHYGSAVGSAQRLVETHLAPGVADWNIVVPMPPPCAQAQVMGADMRVCDADAPPNVIMSDARSARVHRAGQLAGFATVNVTVYCILPLAPPPPPSTTSITPPLSYLTYEMLSNKLSSKEVTSNEDTSYESESSDLKSAELTTTVKPTSSTTSPPIQEETTAHTELTPPTEVVPAPPKNATRPQDKTPHSLKVTINITPTNEVPTDDDVSQSYGVELPSFAIKEQPDQSPRFSSVPYIVTPPRISAMPPWKHVKQPRGPGSPAQLAAAPHQPPGAYPHSAAHPHPGAHQHLGAHQQPNAHRLPGVQRRPRLRPPHYPPSPQHSATPSPYDLMPPNSLAPGYRPLSLISPWLTLLQRRQPLLQRHQPLLFFRHF